jgi:PucR C-terminal helix-turn-helix domain
VNPSDAIVRREQLTAPDVSSATARGAAALRIDDAVLRVLRERLPDVATHTVEAVTREVPGYTGALSGSMGANIEAAVQMALAGFLRLAGGSRGSDPSTPLGPTLEGAYALGRGEARSGRSMDALLAAYRVGARVSWRELSASASAAGVQAGTMAQFAELVFAYIDELSAASVAGHTDELSTSGRVRERYRERLGQHLLAGAGEETLVAAAERATWTPPTTLTAVLLPSAQVRAVLASLSPGTLQVGEDLPGLPGEGAGPPYSLLLVPDVEGPGRRHLLRVLDGRPAVVGPPRPWTRARTSYDRAMRTVALPAVTGAPGPVDSEDHLAELVVTADGEALADLRARALAPLADLRPATRGRLAETLRAWLLLQGRRDAVAAHLHVHAQTVRYRMGQLREAYGARLDDPDAVLDLLVALHPDPAAAVSTDSGAPGTNT